MSELRHDLRIATAVLVAVVVVIVGFAIVGDRRRVVAMPTPEIVRKVVEETPTPTAKPKPKRTPDPTPNPTPEPTPEPVPVPESDAVAVILDVFGSMGAVRVADCESGDGPSVPPGPPYRINPAAKNGPHAGTFQINVNIHARRIARLGFTPAQMFQLRPNVIVAKDLHDDQGWGPWVCGWAA